MAKLLIRNGASDPVEILLEPGVYRVGRDPSSDIQIDDPSVSATHCEMTVQDGVIYILDLGSTNGTFHGNNPVQECMVRRGEVFKLGDIEVVFEPDATPAPSTIATAKPAIRLSGASAPAVSEAVPPLAEVAVSAGAMTYNPDDCVNHPGTLGQLVCQKCGSLLCGACVQSFRSGSESLHSCRSCGGICLDLKKQKTLIAKRSATFFSLVPDAFKYPFKRNGVSMLVCGTLFFAFLEFLQRYSFSALASLLMLVIGSGYLIAFLQSIVTTSANGEENMPGWPEFLNYWDDIILPFLQILAIWVVCLLPGFLVHLYVSESLAIPTFILGLFLLPMMVLTVSMAGSLSGLNPLIVISSIVKVPGAYTFTALLFLFLVGLKTGGEHLLALIPIPVLPSLVVTFIGLYLLIVEMRILGLLYYLNQEKLNWY